jgi:AIPR protein
MQKKSSQSFNLALRSRSDLEEYGVNARMLMALEIRYGIDDIHTAAETSLTDDYDDKKCDLVYVDRGAKVAVIAQAYEAKRQKSEAPANKASDLNTAAGWLLSRQLSALPVKLQSAAKELREAVTTGEIETLEFWFVHNLPESKNVENELATVEHTAVNALKGIRDGISVRAQEVGKSIQETWYRSLQTPILVTDTFSLSVDAGYEIAEADWQAYVTSVPAVWLRGVYLKHSTDLFSANLRDYLGSRATDQNINHGIKTTATKDPMHLWVFNNGLTALVNSYSVAAAEDPRLGSLLTLQGLSIVNGAQTTGVIGTLGAELDGTGKLPMRFVKCGARDTILNIVRYNNSQNKLEAADFRSNDRTQKRLRAEFQKIPAAVYLGGRRGGYEDVAKRPKNLMSSDTCAQALATAHLDPVVAYNQKSQIWTHDEIYSKYFNDQVTAEHIVFCYALFRSVEVEKVRLRKKRSKGLTQDEAEQFQFLRQRGSLFILTAAIAACIETVIAQSVPNLFRVSFGKKVSPAKAQDYWKPIVKLGLPFHGTLKSATENVLNDAMIASEAVKQFRSMVSSTQKYHEAAFRTFQEKITVSAS